MNAVNIKLYDSAKNEFKSSESDAKEFANAVEEAVIENIKANTNEYKSL